MTVLFSWVIPYVVLVVFMVGIIRRLAGWLHIPVPFKLTVFPSPGTTGGAVLDLCKETIGLRSLWRGHKGLWFAAWLFHLALAFVLVGHFFGILFLGRQFVMFGVTPAQSEQLSVLGGTYAGLGLTLGLLLLTLRRVGLAKLRFISTPGDYLVLVILAGIIGSGMYMRFFTDVTYLEVYRYLGGLLTFHPVPPPAQGAFLVHFTLVELLLIYFPYSKLLHACGLFLSRWLITRPYERQVILK